MQLLLTGAAVLLATSGVLAGTKLEVSGPTVFIRNGTIIGKHVKTLNQDLFLGIPFAQPPTGNLRFSAPQPVNETWATPLNASTYGAQCINYLLGLPFDPSDIATRYPQSEDCLRINVVRPAGTKSNAGLPVLAYIYRGGFQEGGSSDDRYNVSALVENSVQIGRPSIVVSMNYRLQGWGFLAGNDVSKQGLLNLGIQDQRLALQWIQDNINPFGGDRRRVTIQGESAGAASFYDSYSGEKTYESVLKATNCTHAHDKLQCLRAAPFETLDTTFTELSFLPVIDGTLVPEYTSTALAKGSFVKVPLLIGANTDEGKVFAGMGVNTTDELGSYIMQYPYIHTARNETIRDLLEVYPEPGTDSTHGQSDDTIPMSAPYEKQFLRAARYTGDAMFVAGRRHSCEIWTRHGLPCYSYRFNTIPGGTDPLYLGATHFQEIAFVFGNILGLGMPSNAFDVQPLEREERYKKLSDLMGRTWMSFAATHSPNNHKVKSFQTAWPAYSINNPRNMVFDGNTISFVEKDDWRAAALQMIIERSSDFSR
ncbi:alpha beta-hydrolase [Fusarium sp. NRRL 25303]|nr:alpha beta-hydrolase [Fusarium sp. NRRL 25303]